MRCCGGALIYIIGITHCLENRQTQVLCRIQKTEHQDLHRCISHSHYSGDPGVPVIVIVFTALDLTSGYWQVEMHLDA